MSDEYPVQRLCELFAVSRSGYYTWRKGEASPRARHDAALAVQIAAVHAKSRGTYGSPRVTLDLQESGERVGRHRVARLMRRAGLRGRQKRRYRVVTTDSRHGEPIAPNRLAAHKAGSGLADRPDLRAHRRGLALLGGRPGSLQPPAGGLGHGRLVGDDPADRGAENGLGPTPT